MGALDGPRLRPRPLRLPLLALCTLLSGCSPLYVVRAGIAEARILAARQPIPEVVLDPATDETLRGKLILTLEARDFARDTLGLDVGDSYTTYVELERDTLALVLSGAHRDRLEAKTWWFPIVGHVPYRGYFSVDDALEAQRDLEEDGLDTYLRPTAAFSTLGWFSDPLLSTVARLETTALIETVLHELSHNHLFVSGRVRFNESFANFVGGVGAAEFFCRRQGGGPDTTWCQRAQGRWRDARRFGRFLDGLVSELQAVYADPAISTEEKLERREEIFERHGSRFVDEVQPTFEVSDYSGFLARPLNNATLLQTMLYYHRLDDFHALYEAHGRDLGATVRALAEGAERVDDPFELLPDGSPGADSYGSRTVSVKAQMSMAGFPTASSR